MWVDAWTIICPLWQSCPWVHLFLSPEVLWNISDILQKVNAVLRCSEPPESQPTDHWITLDSGGISICLLMGIHIFYILPLKFYELGGSHFKITTALRYGHLNSYQSEQPHYSKVCLLSQNKIYWPSEGVKNIDLSWFWLYRVVWRRRLQKIVFKMGQRLVKTHYRLQD
jgi:hypothetical protein